MNQDRELTIDELENVRAGMPIDSVDRSLDFLDKKELTTLKEQIEGHELSMEELSEALGGAPKAVIEEQLRNMNK